MFYKLEIENFYSIRDLQVIDLTVDGKVEDGEGRLAPIFEGSAARVPKVIAIYGANASGKTTVLRALHFILSVVKDSVDRGFGPIDRFNDTESGNRPTRFAIEFGGAMDLGADVARRVQSGEPVTQGVYRYELELANKDGNTTHIVREALRQRPNAAGRWVRVFERATNRHESDPVTFTHSVKDSPSFSLSGFQHLVKTLAGNHSVISSFAKFQHPAAQLFVEAARQSFFQVEPLQAASDMHIVQFLKRAPAVVEQLGRELGRIDVGVEGLAFRDGPDGPYLTFRHTGLDLEMPWALESHGTRAFIKLFPFLSGALEVGGLAAIDELDAALHPLLIPNLLRWFYCPSGRNPLEAQLWLTCHSASLLDDLTKEEIVMCEKDHHGRSRVYSLMDVQAETRVRRDNNHYRKYLGGHYGAVPRLG